MTARIYLLVGQIAAGKTTFAAALAPRISGRVIKTSEIISHLGAGDRLYQQSKGDQLDQKTKGGWIRDAIARLQPTPGHPVIVDAIRARSQILRIREKWPTLGDVIIIGVRTSRIEDHLKSRNLSADQVRDLVVAYSHPLERNLPMDECDIIYDNTRLSMEMLWPK